MRISVRKVTLLLWLDVFTLAMTIVANVAVGRLEALHEQHVPATDPALSFPLVPNTVSNAALWIVVAFGTFIVCGTLDVLSDENYRVRPVRLLTGSLLGAAETLATNSLIVQILKRGVGRPRPNFFALVTADVSDPQARLSFPSGHTATAFAASVFLILVILDHIDGICGSSWSGAKDPKNRSHQRKTTITAQTNVPVSAAVLRPHPSETRSSQQRSTVGLRYVPTIAYLLILTPVWLALWVGTTRVTDYWHHVSDVLAGALIGSTTAVFCWWKRCKRQFPAVLDTSKGVYSQHRVLAQCLLGETLTTTTETVSVQHSS